MTKTSAKPPVLLGFLRKTAEVGLDQDGSTGAQKLADFLERLDSAYLLYGSGEPEEKRELVAELTSNWVAEGRNVDFTALPEVQLVAERAKSIYGRPYRDTPRTWDALLSKLAKALSARSNADQEHKS